MSIGQRRRFIRDDRRCFLCFRKNHNVKDCRSARKCPQCGKTHHRLLHNPNSPPAKSEAKVLNTEVEEDLWYMPDDCFSDDQGDNNQDGGDHIVNSTQCVLSTQLDPVATLPYAAVFLSAPGGRQTPAYALLDTCSSTTLISNTLAERLGLTGMPLQVTVNTVTGTRPVAAHSVRVCLNQYSKVRPAKPRIVIDALAMDSSFCAQPLRTWTQDELGRWPHLQGVAVNTHEGVKVVAQVLLGADHAHLFLPSMVRKLEGDPTAPVAFSCALGWVVYGPTGPKKVCPTPTNVDVVSRSARIEPVRSHAVTDEELSTAIDKFWVLEAKGETLPTVQERYALKLLKDGWSLDAHHRLTLPVLWKPGEPNFPNNYALARSRLISSERKKEWNTPTVHQEYKAIIAQYLEQGYAREVFGNGKGNGKYYIPHFPVVRMDHESTKVRIVMDAAAKHEGKSLNDAIMSGPSLIGDLVQVLLRFRKDFVGISGDVSQMFLRVRMPETDRPYHRWIYREHPLAVTREFEMNSHVFGNAGSPCIAMFAAQENARRYYGSNPEFQEAVAAVTTSTIMDDTLYSLPNTSAAVDLANKLIKMYANIGMKIHKFASNDPAVMATLDAEVRSKLCDKDIVWNKDLTALGLRWDANADTLSFVLTKPAQWLPLQTLSKRTLLQSYMHLFDPLGTALPFIMQARIIFRQCWVEKVGWDEELPSQIRASWNEWRQICAQQLSGVVVPRHLQAGSCGMDLCSVQVHAFADASCQAYAACVYIVNPKGNNVSLAYARARIAPIRGKQSIPRLELQACQLAVSVAKKVCSALKFPSRNVIYWTDSKANLYWLRTITQQLSTFVSNRVESILAESSVNQWRWVPGTDNPADIASRGASLPLPTLWLEGPPFLLQPESAWPTLQELDPEDDAVKVELVKRYRDALNTNSTSVVRAKPHIPLDIAWERCSSLNRLIKGLQRLVRDTEKGNRVKNMLIRQVQLEAFSKEIANLRTTGLVNSGSRLKMVSPYLDRDGIMRVAGRLKNAANGEPIILPPNHRFTILLLQQIHREGKHCIGPEQVLATFRQQYYAQRVKTVARRVHRSCVQCKRLHGRPMTQIMAPLPKSRIPNKPSRAFLNTAVDIGGPYTVKTRGTATAKRWFVLFCCFQTRAVHLEHLTSLHTDEFLRAFSRFTSRRGHPELLYMDNAKTFEGAANKLATLLNNNSLTQQCKFAFSPPYGPHFNGSAERMIQAAKHALRGTLTAGFRDDDFRTALVIAEGLINSNL